MEKIWKCKIGGEVVGDLPAGADWPMRRAVQTAFETLTGVEASFTFSGWGASLTEGERAVHENREPNWDAMQQEGQHPLEGLHINQGSLDAAADAYEAEYNEAQEARRVEKLRKLGARLAELLDEDQFAECEALLLAAGVMPEEKDNVAKA